MDEIKLLCHVEDDKIFCVDKHGRPIIIDMKQLEDVDYFGMIFKDGALMGLILKEQISRKGEKR